MIPYHDMQRALSDLVTAPFLGCHRTGSVITFGFGAWVRRDRRKTETPALALEISCPWRLTIAGELFATSADIFRSATLPAPRGFDPEEHRTVCDVRLSRFLQDLAPRFPRVRAASATASGDLRVELGDEIVLELFADRAPEEAWRLCAAADAPRTATDPAPARART